MCVCVCVCVSLRERLYVDRQILIYIFNTFILFHKIMYIMSSSSYRAGSTDIPDPLSPLLPIVHRPR